MRKFNLKGIAVILSAISLLNGCTVNTSTHEHNFSKKVMEEEFLKENATCIHGDIYYYSCECGEKGEETFNNFLTIPCDYSAQVEEEEFLKHEATCQMGAEYYKSCTMCGNKAMKQTFFSNKLGEHSFTEENPSSVYIKDEATHQSSAVYYKSCSCGAMGTETFSFGDPLREYTPQEKVNYTPTSLTVTLFDTANSVYGFTYNTKLQPLRPVIQVSETNDFATVIEFPARSNMASTISHEGGSYTEYYIVKAEVTLEAGKTYYYRAYDKYVDVGSPKAQIKAKDFTSQSFTFAHVSDSQIEPATGEYFAKVLSYATTTSDFIVHTGDVVETSLYESQWTRMLHDNFNYLSSIPLMAISGNHETTYKNGNNETFKHFNNNIPAQNTNLGYYYSFVYGNAKFIMLNTNRLSGNKLTDDQYNWLIEELENNTSTWTFVAMHNPMYSAGTYGSNPDRNQISVALRQQLHNLFVEYGVDVVLQGHDHLISKTYPLGLNGDPTTETWQTINETEYSVSPEGVIYVMSGTAGTQTRSVYAHNSSLYTYTSDSKQCSWSEFSINGNTLSVVVKFIKNGQVNEMHEWAVLKNL